MKTIEIRIQLNETLLRKGYPVTTVIESMPQTSEHNNDTRYCSVLCDVHIAEVDASPTEEDNQNRRHNICQSVSSWYADRRNPKPYKKPKNR